MEADHLVAERVEERRDLAVAEGAAGQLEAALLDRLLAGERLDGAGAELAAELEFVEERERGLPVPRLERELGRPDAEVEVGDQCVEPPVADHVAEVLAQRLALLAGDLVGVGDDVVEAVVGVDPLGGVALADTRTPGRLSEVSPTIAASSG